MKKIVLTVLLACASPAVADMPEVTDVRAVKTGDSWRFDVSILHPDTGWDHYADGWKVLAADGTVLGERPLAHPHENEQPFTRSQSGIVIPEGTTEVYIAVSDNVDGYFDQAVAFTLPQ